MSGFFPTWFGAGDFMPHGYCFLWTPSLLWLDVLADLITAASYLSIPFALWYFVKQRRDVPFRWVFVMFGVFVLACGTTHLFEVWNIWHADYWFEAGAKAITAGVSATTAFLLWPLIPRALLIPSREQLENANGELRREVMLREQAEHALRLANEELSNRVVERTSELDAERKRGKQTAADLAAIVDCSNDAIIGKDLNGIITSWNRAAAGLYGYSAGEAIGQPVAMLAPKERLQEIKALTGRVKRGDKVANFDTKRIRKDGGSVDVSLSLSPITDADGRNVGISTIARDISERVRAEQDLRASELRYRAIADSAPNAFVTSDAAGRIIGWNPSAERDFGYTPAEAIGQPLTLLIPQRLRDGHLAAMNRVQSGGAWRAVGETVELLGRRKDGSEFPMEMSLSRWVIGEDQFFNGIIRDVTERKLAEAKVQRLTQLYAALSQCNEAIVRCAGEQELFAHICRDAVQYGGMKMAWVGLIDADTRMIRFAAMFGEGAEEYLQGAEISVDGNSPLGRGPVGIAIRGEQAVWCQDFQNTPFTAPWHDRRARFGWKASAALPLHRHGVAVGVLALYAGEIGAFDEAARNLLVEMAMDISFALDNFARETARQSAEEHLRAAEEQFRGLVEQSIAGIYIIQIGKLAYVNRRFAEILGYAAAEDLIGTDPLLMVAETDRGRVMENMRRWLEGEVPAVNHEFTAVRKDGVMIEIGVHGARATHQGQPAIIGLMQDISEKKRANAQIQRYITQLRTAFLSTVEVATSLSEMRDPYTAGHERRVGQIAAAIGAELGLDAQRVEGLRVAGQLHDIGKITIPAEILSKPGKLSPVEFDLIRSHAQSGYDVLKEVEFPWPVAEIALQHHERMDGSGYPQGLKGEAILFEARIMAVADVIEAMSSHRPYRPGLGIDRALAEIEQGRGRTYDPAVADACLQLFREKRYQMPA